MTNMLFLLTFEVIGRFIGDDPLPLIGLKSKLDDEMFSESLPSPLPRLTYVVLQIHQIFELSSD